MGHVSATSGRLLHSNSPHGLHLRAEGIARVLLEQLGQLLTYAVFHRALDRLHGLAVGAVEYLPARCYARRFAFGVGGKPGQLLDLRGYGTQNPAPSGGVLDLIQCLTYSKWACTALGVPSPA